MIGRDPGLRQPSDHQQLPDVLSISPIALGALLVPAPGRGFGGFGEVHDRVNPAQLVGDEPPAGRCLQRNLELPAAELLTEPPHPSPIRWRDPRAHHLAGIGIHPLRGDLRTVLIQTHHDRHLQTLSLPARVATTTHGLGETYRRTQTAPAHAIYRVTPGRP
jgi:hypothetical protein